MFPYHTLHPFLQALGDDVISLGGTVATNDFLALSNSRSCGKLQALEELLARWSRQRGNNKVRGPGF